MVNKKRSANVASVIEIGAYSVKMRVSQIKKGTLETLDQLEYPINLGQDIFYGNRITFENFRLLSSILEKYKTVSETYCAGKTKTVAGPTLREAENSAFILDQIKLQTGMDVNILDDCQEKAALFYELVCCLKETQLSLKGNSLIVYVGSASIEIAVYNGTHIIHSMNFPAGALKISDILLPLRRESDEFHIVVSEYIDALLKPLFLPFKITNLIFSGPEMPMITELTGTKTENKISVIETGKLVALFDSIKVMTIENIADKYRLTESEAAILYHTLFFYMALIDKTAIPKQIYAPDIDILDACTSGLLFPKHDQAFIEFCRAGTLLCTENLVRDSEFDEEHVKYISDLACTLFDRTKRIHGLDASYKHMVKLASVLFTAFGSFHSENSVEAIRHSIENLDIFAFGKQAKKKLSFIVANACCDPSIALNLSEINQPDYDLGTVKLSAIFRLACTLDQSQKKKLKNVRMALGDEKLTIRAETSENILLERWAFDTAAEYFKDMFGIHPELIVKLAFL